MPCVSCLIPLHRSRAFLPYITANIDAHLSLGAEVVVSDRHLLDDTIDVLRDRYRGVGSVRLIAADDAIDWVANINLLLDAANGEFVRIVPHDDSATAESTASLLAALRAQPDAVLATGIVLAEDLDGHRLPDRHQMNEGEAGRDRRWTPDDALEVAFMHRFLGAFKGLVRTECLRRAGLRIRPTPTLQGSERLWLFAIALVGRMCFVPGSVLIKRYYPESVHRSWSVSARSIRDNAMVMGEYCDALVDDTAVRTSLQRNIRVNSERLARWLEAPEGPSPGYLPRAITDSP